MSVLNIPKADSLSCQAASLTQHLLADYSDQHGAGFMSCTVYDTAWVSLVKRQAADGGQPLWVFPECFQYVLDTQRDDGGWDAYNSDIDGILNTAASLLALQRHAESADSSSSSSSSSSADLGRRIERATAALQNRLAAWDVSQTSHVGFEIIVPTLLRLLGQGGLEFEFEGKHALMEIHAAKMSRFRPEILYGKMKLTALHSLEAFMGMIDYEKVAHHKLGGGFMASPSSTAAYLIGLPPTSWDPEAEDYLREVLRRSPGNGCVPSAFPSTNFEFSWVLSTLLQAGFTRDELGPSVKVVADVLERAFEAGNGVVGFAPSIMADADDTAKTLSVLNILCLNKSAAGMVDEFETETHFRTYPSERDSSLSANCNVLLALLHQPEPSQYASQIAKGARFLCDTWWKTDGPVKDKWNLSHIYPSMLMMQALVEMLELIESGRLPESVLDRDTRVRASIAIFQAGARTMREQDAAGCWNNSVEETAYAVILLSVACRVVVFDPIRSQLRNAVQRGSAFLEPRTCPSGDYLWIEKVTYRSAVVCQAYRLAALKLASSIPTRAVVGRVLKAPATIPRQGEAFLQLYKRTPLFSETPEEQLRAALVEGFLFSPLLQQHKFDVFNRAGLAVDKYLDMIPFTWTGCDMRAGFRASPLFLWEMMNISMLSYQVDEFIEAEAGPAVAGDLKVLRDFVLDLFPDDKKTSAPKDVHMDGSPACRETAARLEPLRRYVDYIRNHWAVAAASAADQVNLDRELQLYLLAHIQQLQDNLRLAGRGAAESDDGCGRDGNAKWPASSFFSWVRSTSADHTSAPCYFAFLACLIPNTVATTGMASGGRGTPECFRTVEEKYLAAAASRHLATMCRMYNDLGSVARDAAEGNLNSLDFAEFRVGGTASAKGSLFSLAQFERACLMEAMGRLQAASTQAVGTSGRQRASKTRWMACWRMFCDVTDLYGQIYVLRDMSSRVVKEAGEGVTFG
ncbi:ent-kaurene synthase [Colletotrichum navitas]|uniref:Ent-kaurene synthase n=1 Tax=Colletotrichum navitas TaxID=681940 RepID=A0AAD8UXW8_9PEZI|nr:ent-kaurene synthase [Colletotrichum navitas]KAK1561739.1 ent-kaurene synthase [Colletotrichum navitas]